MSKTNNKGVVSVSSDLSNAKAGLESSAHVKATKSNERLKLAIILLMAISAVVGYYHFESQKLIAFGILALGAIVSTISFLLTTTGKRLVLFFKEAKVELRKVVWPTVDETKKMTLLVLVVIAIVMIYLMIVDSLLRYLINLILKF